VAYFLARCACIHGLKPVADMRSPQSGLGSSDSPVDQFIDDPAALALVSQPRGYGRRNIAIR